MSKCSHVYLSTKNLFNLPEKKKKKRQDVIILVQNK